MECGGPREAAPQGYPESIYRLLLHLAGFKIRPFLYKEGIR